MSVAFKGKILFQKSVSGLYEPAGILLIEQNERDQAVKLSGIDRKGTPLLAAMALLLLLCSKAFQNW